MRDDFPQAPPAGDPPPATDALAESEARFRSIFQNMCEGVALHQIVDGPDGQAADYRIVEVNHAFQNHTGIPMEQAQGALASQLYGVSPPPLLDLYSRVARSGKSCSFDMYFPPLQRHFAVSVYSSKNGYFTTVFSDVTERRWAWDLLRRSESSLARAQAIAHLGSWHWDFQRKSVTWSAEMYKIHGVDPNTFQLTAESLALLIHPEDRGIFEQSVAALRQGRNVDPVEYRVVRPDGQIRMVQVAGSEIESDDAGQPLQIFGTVLDITERRQAEDALRMTQFSVDHAADGIYCVAPDASIVTVNDSACRMLGYTRDELVGLSVFNIDTEYSPDNWRNAWEEVKRQGSMTIETHHRARDGTIFPVELTANYINFGGREYSYAFVRDITERKRADEALRMTQFSVDHAVDGLYWIAPDARIILVNEAACRMLGYTRQELQGLTVLDITPNAAPEAWRKAWEELKAHGTWQAESLHRTKDGRLIPVEIAANYLEYAGREYSCAFVRDITERKRVEEVLRETTQRLRLATASGQLGVWDCDLVNDVLLWDDRMLELYGLTRQAFTKNFEAWRRALHPDDDARAMAEVQAVCRGEKEFDTVFRIVQPNGSVRTLKANALTIRDEDGRAIRMIGLNRDITEQEKAADALRESEERYRSLFDHMFDGYAYCRMLFEDGRPLDFIYLDVNNAFERLTGLKDVVGKKVTEIIPGIRESASDLFEVYGRVALSGKSEKLETYLDALGIWFSIAVYCPRREYFVAVFENITPRKQAEDELREAERRFREIMENVNLLTIILDSQANITFCNRCLFELTGWRTEEVLGANWIDLFIPPEIREEIKRTHAALIMKDSAFFHYENEILTRCGDRLLIAWDNTVLRDAKGKVIGTASLGRNITEQRQMEEQLRQSHKMDAIGQLAGGIAHDFNNLLTGILGYANMLKLDCAPGSPVYDAAHTIERAAERAAELTQKLLGFARRGKFLAAPVDLGEIVREVVGLLSRTIDKKISITQRLCAEAPCVLGDPGQIQQVVLNLAINARDAMAGGGELTIQTAIEELDEAFCRPLPGLEPGPHAVITVHDTGCGIPAEIHDRIFEPFFTTKEQGKGTGMGLAMVYGIVKNHGGHISLESQPGCGATFKIYLPLHAESALARREHPQEISAQGSGRVLLVDDEDVIRTVAGKMLYALGYEVLAAADGQEAVRICREQAGRIDLAIIDMIMPRMDGQETFRALREIQPGLKAILSSGFGIDGRAQAILDEGMAGFIQKPYKMSEFAELVAQTLTAR